MGHHADDQLETALLRIARGSGTYGAAGMAPFRRWGAGWDKEDPVQYGVLGLQTWLLRPLLRFSKVSEFELAGLCLKFIDRPGS